MKKIVIIILALLMTFVPVKAANYEIRELIPINIETTIVTDNFSYKSFMYNNHSIVFKGIKNLTDNQKSISISIGLFDKNKKNIGTINYCDDILQSKEEKAYEIRVSKENLAEKNTVNDIKYIAVLSDNINCRTTGTLDYIGQKVEEIGIKKNTTLDNDSMLFIKILAFIVGIAFLVFIYEFVFTNRYTNFDGKDVRTDYKKYNDDLRFKREYEKRTNPPPPPVKKKIKTDKVLMQEEAASNKESGSTDLHNMYK